MEVERSHEAIDKLGDALDALEKLKKRLGDAFPDKKYEQQKKRLLNAAFLDDKRAAKAGGDKSQVVQVPTKLTWTLVNSAVGNGHDWESAYASLDEKIIPGDWISDRLCPTSNLGGCETRRRCCEVDGERYYARLVKHTAGKFALYQGNVKSDSEVEAPSVAKEPAKETKEVRPPAHHCHSLLTPAHCSLTTDACSACSLLTAHSACCPPCLSCVTFFLSLLPPTACRRRRRRQTRRPQETRKKARRNPRKQVKKQPP